MDKLFKISEAAEILNMSESVLRKWHAVKKIKTIKVGPKNIDKYDRDRRVVRIAESELQRLMENS